MSSSDMPERLFQHQLVQLHDVEGALPLRLACERRGVLRRVRTQDRKLPSR